MKILWVKAGSLVPLDTGGKIRSYHILRQLALRHDVTVFAFYPEHSDDHHKDLSRIFHRVIHYPLRLPDSKSFGDLVHFAPYFFSLKPYQVTRYCRPQVSEALLNLIEAEKFDVIVCDFLAAAGVIPWHLSCPKVLFTHNVEALIWKRQCLMTRNPIWKALFWREYQATARAERYYLNLADHVLTVSDTDRDFFAQIIDLDKLTAIPTGVDLEFFQPVTGEEQADSLVFTGSMDWRPNEDGIRYFIDQILPRIRSEIPQVRLSVVGRRPSPRLLELARKADNVLVTGMVQDIRPYVQRGAVYIVPLRVGSGTRLKIFEAMAMGKAVVSTSLGAEGLPVLPGRDLLIADNPEQFACSVVGLLQDHVRRNELGQAARRLVARQHGWDAITKHFESALEILIRNEI